MRKLLFFFLACQPWLAGAQEAKAPFVTTPAEVVDRMLRLANTGASDYVVDLGSGDGRIVIAAARDYGARGLGVDLDPKLVALSRESARRAGVADRARFEERDVLLTDLSQATVVTIYLLPWLIDRLQPKLLAELRPGARIVTHAFGMVGWKPDRAETVRLSRPHEMQGGESELFLWFVPAQARGEWRGGGWRLRVAQNFQEIEIEAEHNGIARRVEQAKLEGKAISFGGPGFQFRGEVDDRRIAGTLEISGRAQAMEFLRRP